jgi:hypothetical protein
VGQLGTEAFGLTRAIGSSTEHGPLLHTSAIHVCPLPHPFPRRARVRSRFHRQILHIKESLQEKEGIDVKQIRLIHSGKQLCVVRGGRGNECGEEVAAGQRGAPLDDFDNSISALHTRRSLASCGLFLLAPSALPLTPRPRTSRTPPRSNDTETIEASKIEAGATIHMVLSLRGGAF